MPQMLADLEPNTDPNNAYGSRYFSCVIGEGIYYFAVLGSSGVGRLFLISLKIQIMLIEKLMILLLRL